MIFAYGEKETDYLKKKDRRLAAAIEEIGPICREVDPDLFSSIVHHIVGQQISTAAQRTVWQRMLDAFGRITPAAMLGATQEQLQSQGMTFRKAQYIQETARSVADGRLDLEALRHKSDAEVIAELSSLKGIGVWTAEMLLIFCLQRPDVLSFGDLGIHRGLRMLYHHKAVDARLFEKYRKRYSPYASVASLYLWAISSGAIPGMRDYAPVKKGAGR